MKRGNLVLIGILVVIILFISGCAGMELGKRVPIGWCVETSNLEGVSYVYKLVDSNNIVYAATAAGANAKVYKSNDGVNWQNTGNLAGAMSAYTIVKDSKENLYVGTRPNGDVFKSSDGGITWQNTGDLAGAQNVWSLLVASDGSIYAGTYPNGDVFKSSDEGITWQNTGDLVKADLIYDLIELSDGSILAAGHATGTSHARIYKTTDSGIKWANVGAFTNPDYIFSLLQTSDGSIYAGSGDTGRIFKSTNNGASWNKIVDLPNVNQVFSLMQKEDGTIFAGTGPNAELYSSEDNGQTWNLFTKFEGASTIYSLFKMNNFIFATTGPNGKIIRSGCPSCNNNEICEFGELISCKDCNMLMLTLQTIKETYLVGQTVELTDPPAKIREDKITGNVIGEQNQIINQQVQQDLITDFTTNEVITQPAILPDFIDMQEMADRQLIQPFKQPYKGYIIEFEEEPLAKRVYNLKQEIINNEQYLEQASTLQRYSIGLVKSIDLSYDRARFNSRVESHKEKLRNEHNSIKQRISDKLGKEVKPEVEVDKAFNGISLDINDQEARELENVEGVKKVYPNLLVNITLMDSVPLINADDVWQLDRNGNNCSITGEPCLTGKGVSIAIIDTGVDYTHSDLGACTTSEFLAGACSKVVGGYDFVNNDNDPMDDQGHGTHVAATAAGNGVLKGVAPDAGIYAYKVLSAEGRGYNDWIIAGIDRALDPNNDGDFSDHLDVISMSLGGRGNPDDPMSTAVDNVVNNGVVAVIAAGNSGPKPGTVASPGTARKAITIGASDKADQIASFSSRGPVEWEGGYLIKPDITAPGVDICAAQWEDAWSSRECIDTEHTSISGTSMATPHVSGAVALIKQKHPDWTPDEIKMALKSKAIDIGKDVTIQGAGRLDILNTINFNGIPSIAKINSGGNVNSNFDVIGTAIGRDFNKYTLYYGKGENPSDWVEIITSFSPIEEGLLYSNFNIRLLDEGINFLELIVWNNNGETSRDKIKLFVDYVKIIEPLNNDIYKFGSSVEIIGNLTTDGTFNVEYGFVEPDIYQKVPVEWFNDGVVLTNGGVGSIVDNVIASWDTSVLGLLDPSYYMIRINVDFLDGRISSEYIENIYLDPNLKEGWPQKIKWDYNELYERFTWGGFLEPTVSDINKDGNKEIIIYRGGCPPKLFTYNYDGSLLWSETIGVDCMLGVGLPIPLIGNLDKDIYDEIVVLSNVRNETSLINLELSVYNHDGSLLWSKIIPKDYFPTMIMADLDLDGNNEIIVKGNLGFDKINEMLIINKDGQIVSQWKIPHEDEGFFVNPYPVVGDFDDDPNLEIISVGLSEDGQKIYGENTGVIYIYNLDGSIVQGWPVYTKGLIYYSPIVGDVNNDGNHEIIVGLKNDNIAQDENYGGLYVFDRNGDVLPGWPYGKGYMFDSSSALGDVNNDGFLEISFKGIGIVGLEPLSIVASTHLFNHDGTLLPGWPQDINERNFINDRPSAMGDINNDGSLDILTSGGVGISFDKGIYVWDKDNLLLKDFPKMTDASLLIDYGSSVTITDLDNDGRIEIVGSSDNDYNFEDYHDRKYRGSIYVWELNAIYDKSKIPWPMFMHDTQRTGCYDCTFVKSMIKNNGDNTIKGLLHMEVQKNIDGNWITQQVVVDQMQVTIPANNYLALDTIWKDNGAYITTEPGQFRVYVALKDQNNNVLLENSYEFNVF